MIEIFDGQRIRAPRYGALEAFIESAVTTYSLAARKAFVIPATKSAHRFFEEANVTRDIGFAPIRYAGYSISYKPGGRKKDGSNDDKWHAHVETNSAQYLDLRAWFSERALRDSPDQLAHTFYQLPIAPFAPVRRQMLMMLREFNRS